VGGFARETDNAGRGAASPKIRDVQVIATAPQGCGWWW